MDNSYKILDYTVNPQYGFLENFMKLLTEILKQGDRVIMDLALNQTSNWHPWFEASEHPISPKWK